MATAGNDARPLPLLKIISVLVDPTPINWLSPAPIVLCDKSKVLLTTVPSVSDIA